MNTQKNIETYNKSETAVESNIGTFKNTKDTYKFNDL